MKSKILAVVFAAAFLFTSGSVWAKPVNPSSDEDVAELKADAEKGDRGAQYELSMVYTFRHDGEGALKWLTASAENGFGKAQYTLGNLYYTGSDTVKKDYEKAIQWFEASKETVYKGAKVDELIASAKQKLEDQKNAAAAKKKAAEDAKKKAAVKAKEAAETAKKAAAEAAVKAEEAARESAEAAKKAAGLAAAKAEEEARRAAEASKSIFQKAKEKILSFFE